MLDFVSMEAEVKERPILFRSEMVQAYLASHKWQTRRIIKFPKHTYTPDTSWVKSIHQDGGGNWIAWSTDAPDLAEFTKRAYPGAEGFTCPYGSPGDSLWVKETFWRGYSGFSEPEAGEWRPVPTRTIEYLEQRKKPGYHERGCYMNKVPSIFMPRWASRISFPIVNIRPERVQDISKADCIAEGIYWSDAFPEGYTLGYPLPGYSLGFGAAEDCYKALWNTINAKRGYGWDVQSWWVWVIEFPKYEVVQ